MRKNIIATVLILFFFPVLVFGYEVDYDGLFYATTTGPSLNLETQHGRTLIVFNDWDYSTSEPRWAFTAVDFRNENGLKLADEANILTFNTNKEVVPTTVRCRHLILTPYSLEINFTAENNLLVPQIKAFNGESSVLNGLYATDTGTFFFIEGIGNFVKVTWYRFNSSGEPEWVISNISPIVNDSATLTFYKYKKQLGLTSQVTDVLSDIRANKGLYISWFNYSFKEDYRSIWALYDKLHPTTIYEDQTVTLHIVDNTPSWVETSDGQIIHLTKIYW